MQYWQLLQWGELGESAAALSCECEAKGMPLLDSSSLPSKGPADPLKLRVPPPLPLLLVFPHLWPVVQRELEGSLAEGEEAAFFKAWEAAGLGKGKAAASLEFMTRVFFATLPLRKADSDSPVPPSSPSLQL